MKRLYFAYIGWKKLEFGELKIIKETEKTIQVENHPRCISNMRKVYIDRSYDDCCVSESQDVCIAAVKGILKSRLESKRKAVSELENNLEVINADKSKLWGE